MENKPLTIEEIQAKLPLIVEVTKEMIDDADIYDLFRCIGAKALKSIFPNNFITWGIKSGSIYETGYGFFGYPTKGMNILTMEDIDMTTITKPIFVTFKAGPLKQTNI